MLAVVLGCQSTPSLLHKRPKGRFGLHAIVCKNVFFLGVTLIKQINQLSNDSKQQFEILPDDDVDNEDTAQKDEELKLNIIDWTKVCITNSILFL